MTSDDEVRAAALQAAVALEVGWLLHAPNLHPNNTIENIVATADQFVRYIQNGSLHD